MMVFDRAYAQQASRIEESSRFLKKAAQKLLLCRAWGVVADTAHSPALTKFFCFFLFTKRSLPFATGVWG
ncbi:hypothetical protein [Acidocella sp.]|jgi:hypothetical protein|uniref:hypothetical protein n=1 Tax=Acidocella sp. TaxID=50710 RepID=UPI002F409371